MSSNNFFTNILTYAKMSQDSSAKSYQNNKWRLKKKLVKGVKEEKEKELQYGSERYKNLPEDEKRKIVKYRI